ncbi:MAG: hypothetical protein MJ102_02065 [Clostridia bacterium]|nr:hypothetical protein [Clostridia bacterium]
MNSIHINVKSIALDLLRRAWIMILAFIIVFMGSYYLTESKKVPNYTASSNVLVYPSIASATEGETTTPFVTATAVASQGLINLLTVMITMDASTDIIMKNLDAMDGTEDGVFVGSSGVVYTQQRIGSMIRLASVSETFVMSVTVSCPTASDAVMISNAACNAVPEIVEEVIHSGYAKVLQTTSSAIKSNLPSYRKPFTYGLIVAFLIAAVVIMLNIFDTRVHSKDEVTADYGMLVLGEIPHFSTSHKPTERGYYDEKAKQQE